MNISMKMKKTIFRVFMVSTAVLLFGTASYAGPFEEALKTWENESIYGRIAYVSSDYLIVSEIKVMLVDTRMYGKAYTTSFMDLNGKALSIKSLAVGKDVFVKGSVLWGDKPDKRMLVAREVYLLPKGMSSHEIQSSRVLNYPGSPW